MKVTFKKAVPIAKNITSFYFEPEKSFRYVAGQFVELTLPHINPDDRGTRRWFTLSSSPTEKQLAITTKLAPVSSSFKQTLSALRPGQKVVISEPMGDFVLPKDKSIPLVFLVGGIGVTPFRSMIKWLTDKNDRRQIQLLYSVKTQDEMVFLEVFESFNLSMQKLINQKMSSEITLALAGGVEDKLIYISGPEPMVESLMDQFTTLDVPSNQLVGDYFPGYPA